MSGGDPVQGETPNGGIVTISNKTGKTIYVNKSAQNQDPWHFVIEGVVREEVPDRLKMGSFVKLGNFVTMTVGQNSAGGPEEDANFFVRYESSDHASFVPIHLYCSGGVGWVTNYSIEDELGRPKLKSATEN